MNDLTYICLGCVIDVSLIMGSSLYEYRAFKKVLHNREKSYISSVNQRSLLGRIIAFLGQGGSELAQKRCGYENSTGDRNN